MRRDLRRKTPIGIIINQVHCIIRTQCLPITLEGAWEFLSSPANLRLITPGYMDFRITCDPEPSIYPGQIITYTVKPLLGLRLRWVTEITHVQQLSYFVDEQRSGPYSFWHHKHFIKPIPGGVEMKDIVHYKLPLGILGSLANSLFVATQLKSVFDFRHQKLEEIFGIYAEPPAF